MKRAQEQIPFINPSSEILKDFMSEISTELLTSQTRGKIV